VTKQIVAWNGIEAEEARGTPIFSTGQTRQYTGSIAGGRDVVRYYASGSFQNDLGVEPNNSLRQFSSHVNMTIAPNEKIAAVQPCDPRFASYSALNDGRVVIDASGTSLVVGLMGLGLDTITYRVLTTLNRHFKIAITGPSSISPTVLGPSTTGMLVGAAAGAKVADVSGLAAGETVAAISPNDGRLAIAAGGAAINVGTTASSAGTLTYAVTTTVGRTLPLSVTTVVPEAETGTFVGRLATAPTARRAWRIDAIHKILKQDPSGVGSTVYSRLIDFGFMAGHSAEFAHAAWKSASRNVVDTGGVATWVADQYLSYDGAASYGVPGITPSTIGGGVGQDAISVGYVSLKPNTGNGIWWGSSTGNLRLASCGSGVTYVAGIIDNGSVVAGPANSGIEPGFVALTRTGSTNATIYKDGVAVGFDTTNASTALATQAVWFGRNASAYSAEPVMFWFFGPAFTPAEIALINQAVQYWLVYVVRPIAEMGDSLTNGANVNGGGQSVYNRCATLAQLTGRYVFNLGVNGETAPAIKTRWDRCLFIRGITTFANLGRNTGTWGSFVTGWANETKNIVADMKAKCTGQLIVGSILVGNYPVEYSDGGAQRPVIDQYNADQKVTYGAAFNDINTPLIALGAPGAAYADATAYGHGITPSGIRSDNLHGLDVGATNPMYATMAAVDAATVARLGA
jgi:hypothetical protein